MLYKNKYVIKRLEEQDFPAVKELFWKVFRKKVSITYLKNKYNSNYTSISFISTIAYLGSIPVAFYGAIPQIFSNHNSEIFVAHACDSYTLQDHQGLGLHYQLAKFSYDIMKQYDIKFVYAFHSENTYYSTKKLLWEEYLNLNRFHISIKTFPLAKILNKIGGNSFYSLFYSKKIFPEKISKLNATDSSLFHQKFDLSLISYKNGIKEHYFIEIENCIFWVKIEAIMHVGLFHAPSESMLMKAITKIKRKAFLLGINEILFQLHPKSSMTQYIEKYITPKSSWLVGYLLFDNTICIDNFRFNYSNLDTY